VHLSDAVGVLLRLTTLDVFQRNALFSIQFSSVELMCSGSLATGIDFGLP